MALPELDQKLLLALRTRGHSNKQLEHVIERFSRAGEHGACWYVLGAIGLTLSRTPDRRAAWRRGIGATAISYGLNYAIKTQVRRTRPELEGLPPLSSVISKYSFPSAHSTTSFTAAGTYSRALPAAAPLFYGAATALAISRPYLGVHYPSDVIAGAILGTAVAEALR